MTTQTTIRALIKRNSDVEYYVETNVFMSDGQYQSGICRLTDGKLTTNGTNRCVVSPFSVKLGPVALPKVQAMAIGQTVNL